MRLMRELRRRRFVYRYHADDGLAGAEGCFLNCSFWLVGALARAGACDEATRADGVACSAGRTTSACTPRRSIPRTGAFLGNFPQALVHLALIDAAVAIAGAERGRGTRSWRVPDDRRRARGGLRRARWCSRPHARRERTGVHAHGPAVPARNGGERQPPHREGARVRLAFRDRRAVRARCTALFFLAIGEARWWIGALLGVVHALFGRGPRQHPAADRPSRVWARPRHPRPRSRSSSPRGS